jgi:hypothetical protein
LGKLSCTEIRFYKADFIGDFNENEIIFNKNIKLLFPNRICISYLKKLFLKKQNEVKCLMKLLDDEFPK